MIGSDWVVNFYSATSVLFFFFFPPPDAHVQQGGQGPTAVKI